MGLFGILEFSRKFARLGNFDVFKEKCENLNVIWRQKAHQYSVCCWFATTNCRIRYRQLISSPYDKCGSGCNGCKLILMTVTQRWHAARILLYSWRLISSIVYITSTLFRHTTSLPWKLRQQCHKSHCNKQRRNFRVWKDCASVGRFRLLSK